jgi:hypothetical protein
MLKGTPPPEDPEDNWEEVQAPSDLQQGIKATILSSYNKARS